MVQLDSEPFVREMEGEREIEKQKRNEEMGREANKVNNERRKWEGEIIGKRMSESEG